MNLRLHQGAIPVGLALLALAFIVPGGRHAGGAGPARSPVAAAAVAQDEALLILSDDLGQSEFLDARTGRVTHLDDVVMGDRAVLVWYWRPNCEASRRDAAAVADFARAHRDTVQVVGIGAFGTGADVADYLADTEMSIPLLWEPSGYAWQLNDVHTPSTIQLFSHDLREQSDLLHFDDRGRQIVLDAASQPRYAVTS